MSLDFGLAFNFRNPEPFKVPPAQFYEEMFQQIEYAEELGFDTVWLPEHHFSPDDGYDPNPLTVAAAIAARTERIKIGTWLLLLPLHNALEVAEQAALVDIISGGRLQLGLGLGYRKEEFDAFGIARRARAGRMEEGLEVIRRALGNEQFSFKGRHYNIENGSVYPKPIQQPLPLWVGARSEPAARRAARHDASLLLIDVGGNAKATYDVYAETLRERGRDPADYGVHGMILGSFMISDDPERGVRGGPPPPRVGADRDGRLVRGVGAERSRPRAPRRDGPRPADGGRPARSRTTWSAIRRRRSR